jgi:hypothetical protein
VQKNPHFYSTANPTDVAVEEQLKAANVAVTVIWIYSDLKMLFALL